MSDDDAFPDPGQMTTSVSAASARRAAPQRLPSDRANGANGANGAGGAVDADAVTPDVWPDPGEGSASAGEDRRRGRHR